MKSPRRIDHASDPLLAELPADPPPQDSLFWKMWSASTAVAHEALQTTFVQGIGGGTLDPVTYGGFNVNDAFYCFNAAGDYLTAADSTDDPTLKAFYLAKHTAYVSYNQMFPKHWRIREPSCVNPYEAAVEYSALESDVVSNTPSIYTLVVMIPCEMLWAWLGHQLSPAAPTNLYASWIDENNDFAGAYKMGNYLNEYDLQHPGAVNATTATGIFERAMNYECANFQSAGT